MNRIYKKTSVAILAVLSLTACTFHQKAASNTESKKKEFVQPKVTTYEKDTTTTILVDDNHIQKSNIVKVIKHGDHWHVFTKDGKEHITYTNPANLKDTGGLELVSVLALAQLKGKRVVSIKKHGNHWHVYTADGKEYLTYQDPSSLFKKIKIGQYKGSHHGKPTHSIQNLAKKSTVYKILRHGDHWHIYTTDGGEFISYQDPRPFYPKAKVGEYKGNHSSKPTNPKAVLPKPDTPNKKLGPVVGVLTLNKLKGRNITKIVDHGDHWHVYENGKEIGITKENPRSMFPKAEYIQEKSNHGGHTKVKETDLFTYEDVKEKLDKRVEKILSKNLKKMTHYGKVTDGLPVFGIIKPDKSGRYFYWLHDSHYHAVSIPDLIAMEKEGRFKGITAKEVVAFLKYKVNHHYVIEDRIDTEEEMIAKCRFLAKHYGVSENQVRYFLGNYVVSINGDDLVKIAADDLIVENGIVKAGVDLPKLKYPEKLKKE